ncbi:cytochrome P450 [Streptomyces lydicus]|uniref:cytochrome P450 n=1 Tax=Streptomyces lydicus TaxID=47763 RepID=UPI0013E8F6F0|nr:cytochrome P450 [Streptomyces lydicus]
MDRREHARREVWNAFLGSAARQGDPYALLLGVPEDPGPLYVQLREKGPLYRSAIGTWVTGRHSVAGRILRDRRFGVRLTNGEKAPEAIEFDNSMLGQDPPNHTRLRKLAAPTFNPRRMEKWRSRVEEYVDELIDGILVRRGKFNFMTAFAQQLPVRVVGELLGIPEQYRHSAFRLTRRMAHLMDGDASAEVADDVLQAIDESARMFDEIVALVRENPGENMISDLLPALDDDSMSLDELIALCTFLILAGVETTVNLIGNATATLLGHPEQWAAFKDDVSLAPGVVQETLRYETPVQQYRRIVQEDLELDGVFLPADTELAICAGAANRDPEAYHDPDRFDITRSVTRKGEPEVLSFSLGTHFCLGATLARIEAEVAMTGVANRLPDLRQVAPVRRRNSYIVRGMMQFPVAAA